MSSGVDAGGSSGGSGGGGWGGGGGSGGGGTGEAGNGDAGPWRLATVLFAMLVAGEPSGRLEEGWKAYNLTVSPRASIRGARHLLAPAPPYAAPEVELCLFPALQQTWVCTALLLLARTQAVVLVMKAWESQPCVPGIQMHA